MDMAPYLLLGFLFAGILNEFISAEKIAQHLGKSSFGSVLKAALFGVPLPLCSCGVIPPTMALRKAGASKGAVLSFLIATPTSGVDSIAATYSLMGPFFAVYRVLASFMSALFSGTVANLLQPGTYVNKVEDSKSILTQSSLSFRERIIRIFHYAFIELVSEIGKWLIVGIFIGGVITYILPEDFFTNTLTSGWQTIILMIVISVPIYVCATGSIPIAAALLLKGINPGAAFVFLLAGPATNSVTITVISKFLGKKTTIIYLTTLVISSMGLGFLLDVLWSHFSINVSFHHHIHQEILPKWMELGSALILLILLIKTFIPNKQKHNEMNKAEKYDKKSILTVPDMTCNNCVMHVKNAIQNVDGVGNIFIDLKTKKVEIYCDLNTDENAIKTQIEKAGYSVK